MKDWIEDLKSQIPHTMDRKYLEPEQIRILDLIAEIERLEKEADEIREIDATVAVENAQLRAIAEAAKALNIKSLLKTLDYDEAYYIKWREKIKYQLEELQQALAKLKKEVSNGKAD